MLEEELANDKQLSDSKRELLKKICAQIYAWESAGDSTQLPTKIRNEIKYYVTQYEANT